MQATFGKHSLPGRTLAVPAAHVVLLLVVVSLHALALAVFVRAALRLHHLVVGARPAAEAPADVVPDLREGAGQTRRAHAVLRLRAGFEQEGPGAAAAALHLLAGGRVCVYEGQWRPAITHQQYQEQRDKHLEEEKRDLRYARREGGTTTTTGEK